MLQYFQVESPIIVVLSNICFLSKNNKVIKIVTKYLLDIEMCQPHGWLYTAVVLPNSSADENF